MPPRWMHNTLDLVVYGRVYDDLHAWKDEPARRLGRVHRSERHDWYNCFGTMWTLDDPFPFAAQWDTLRKLRTEGPDAAERHQAYLAHDFYDRVWDTLSRRRRIENCAFWKWLLMHPDVLKEKTGIDVIEGLALTEHPDGNVAWEPEPDLNLSWRNLKTYVEGRPVEDLPIGK